MRVSVRVLRALPLCALLLVLCWPWPARAQEETEDAQLRVDRCPPPDDAMAAVSAEELERQRTERAGDSYDRGLVLYEEGDYRAAVDAFVDSYCSKAHPSAFYNIAQSYERLLNFELSIRYFERYVDQADPEAANSKKAALRADVLRKLPAQVRVATVPAGADVTIRNQAGVSARGVANGKEPMEVTQGTYTMHIEMPGFEVVERELIAKPGLPYSEYVRLEANKGELQINTSPESGRIFVGDRLVGVGSYSASLPVGTYEVTVEAPGQVSATQSIQLSANERISRSIVLEPKKTAGRWTLVTGSGLGLGLGGALAISRVFDQSTTITLAGSIATTGLGLGGAYFGIPEDVTMGDAWYILGSGLVGLVEGSLIGAFFACERQEEAGVQSESCNSAAIAGAALSGSIAGAIAAALTYQRLELATSDGAALVSGAFWGVGSAALLFAVFDSDARIRDPMLFAGLNLGIISAAGVIANSRVSLRRIAIIDLAGVGGVLAGVGMAQAFDSDDELLQHLAILGGLTGLIASTFLTRYMDEDSEAEGTATRKILPSLGAAEDASGASVLSLGLYSNF